jgi:O-antigen/teichoic acid export membrane protein
MAPRDEEVSSENSDPILQRIKHNFTLSAGSNTIGRIGKTAGELIIANIGGGAVLGVYYVFESIYTLVRRWTGLGLGQTLTKKISEEGRSSEYASRVLGGSLLIRLTTLLVVLVAAGFLHQQIDDYVGIGFAWLSLWVLLVVFFVYSDYRSYIQGAKQVGKASVIDSSQEITVVILQILFVTAGWGSFGMINGLLLGVGIGMVAIILNANIYPARPRRDEIMELLNFAKYSYLHSIVGGRKRWIDVLILGYFVNSSLIGVYGIAYSLSRVGITLSSALGKTIYPEASAAVTGGNDTQLSSIFKYTIPYSTVLSFPMIFGAYTVGGDVLTRFYGLDAMEGKTALVILTIAMLFYTIYQPLHQLLYALDKPRSSFIVSLVSTVVNLITGLLLIPQYGIIGAGVSTGISNMFSIIMIYNVFSKSNQISISVPLRPWASQLIAAAAMLISITILYELLSTHSVFGLFGLILSGATVYFIVLSVTDTTLRSQIRTAVRQRAL